MQRRWFLITGIVLILLGGVGFFLRGRLSPAQAGLQIETKPEAQVYVNGQSVGVTPYEGTHAPGEITLRLIPNATNGPLSPWETKLALTQGIQTVVKRDFGETDRASAGEILSFEKITGSQAALTVVSFPDASSVKLDGQIKGFTPARIESVTAGEHEIVVSAPGFIERTILARVVPGHRLTVFAKLAESQEQPQPQVQEELEPQVEILQTPTGFLRVRKEASTSSEEVGRVDPGKKYPYIEENEDASWFKIEYEEGKQGWISAQYAKKVEEEE